MPVPSPASRLGGVNHTAVEKLHISGVAGRRSLCKAFGYRAAMAESMSPALFMEIYNHIAIRSNTRTIKVNVVLFSFIEEKRTKRGTPLKS